MRKSFIAVLLWALSCGLYAQTDSVSIREVEVVAPRSEQRRVSPVTVQSLDASSMRLLGINSVADAVKRFAGVSVRDYGGIGGMKTISLHSLGAAHRGQLRRCARGKYAGGQIDFSRFASDQLATVSLIVGGWSNLMQTAGMLLAALVALSRATSFQRVTALFLPFWS